MPEIKFDPSPEGQAQARMIIGAMKEGRREREEGVPSHYDKDGTPVYRILLSGLRWSKYEICAYTADDGPRRSFNVGRDAKNRWGAVLFEYDEGGTMVEGTPTILVDGLRTMREARTFCEERARRMKWYEGAPW